MDSNQSKLKDVMLPWLAHGHVSPFLELAKRRAQKNFHIYFCSTPIILNSIKKKISKEQSLSIQLIEFHLPSLPNLPPNNHTTNGLPPHLMPILKDALDMASPNFSKILDEVKPDLVVHDYIHHWAPEMAKSRNIRAVRFSIIASMMMCFILHMIKDQTKPFPYPAILPRNFNDIVLRGHEPSSADKEKEKEIFRFMGSLKGSDFILIRNLRKLDGKVIDLFSTLIEKKIVTVGPLVEGPVNDSSENSEIMEWLDKKTKASTVFVSFGSECFLTKDELKEVADGLEFI